MLALVSLNVRKSGKTPSFSLRVLSKSLGKLSLVDKSPMLQVQQVSHGNKTNNSAERYNIASVQLPAARRLPITFRSVPKRVTNRTCSVAIDLHKLCFTIAGAYSAEVVHHAGLSLPEPKSFLLPRGVGRYLDPPAKRR